MDAESFDHVPEGRRKRKREEDENPDLGVTTEFTDNEAIPHQEEGPDEDFNETGVAIMPFNLREELEEGTFEKDGTYVWKNDSDDEKDAWVDQYEKDLYATGQKGQQGGGMVDHLRESEKGPAPMSRKGKEPEGRRAAAPALKGTSIDDDVEPGQGVDRIAELRTVVGLLRPGETVVKALKRLKLESEREKAARKAAKRESGTGGDQSTRSVSMEGLLRLTEACDRLTQIGFADVYRESFEKLSAMLSRVTGIKSAPKTAETMWEYKLEDHENADVHGPFPSSLMRKWLQEVPRGINLYDPEKMPDAQASSMKLDRAGFFRDGSVAYVRQVGDDGAFSSTETFDIGAYLD